MSPRYLLSLKKWPLAVEKALSIISEAPQDGATRTVDFQFGPPWKGRLPLRLFIDGRRVLQCELCDAYPSFLRDVRGWMERCLVLDKEGTLHPELLTLDCADTVLSLVLVHVGWEEDSLGAVPVSFFAAFRSGCDTPSACCFCSTPALIRELYEGLMDCLKRCRSLFDSPQHWHDVHRYDLLSAGTTTQRMMKDLQSARVERMCKIFHKM